MLKASGHELHYYTFPTESGKHNYEVDFLIADSGKICPVEVKSSGYKAHASLDAFCRKFSSRISGKYLIYTKDLRKDGDILYLPAYAYMTTDAYIHTLHLQSRRPFRLRRPLVTTTAIYDFSLKMRNINALTLLTTFRVSDPALMVW